MAIFMKHSKQLVHLKIITILDAYMHKVVLHILIIPACKMKTDRVVKRKHAVLPVCFLPGRWCSVWPGWALLQSGVSPEESPDEECRCTGSQPPKAQQAHRHMYAVFLTWQEKIFRLTVMRPSHGNYSLSLSIHAQHIQCNVVFTTCV